MARFLACLALSLPLALAAGADEVQKPNKIERAANRTAKGVERTGNRAGKAAERTVDKTENWVKKKLE